MSERRPVRGRSRFTPLRTLLGSERIVRALLTHGARPNVFSNAGVTPVMGAAIQSKSAAIVRLLIEAGAVRFRPMLLTALAVVVGASVILADPIFQGLAISLMFGEIAAR